MTLADEIRTFVTEKHVLPAREQGEMRFDIRTGDVAREMKLVGGRIPAVCSALKTRQFLDANSLRLISVKGPKSGQSTTVIYTYEFIDERKNAKTLDRQDPWIRLRGALKDIFTELGGGENYLRKEREEFHGSGDRR
jgi:hypothetical protein